MSVVTRRCTWLRVQGTYPWCHGLDPLFGYRWYALSLWVYKDEESIWYKMLNLEVSWYSMETLVISWHVQQDSQMVDFPAKVQLLLLAKADPDIEGPDVQTPLFDAAYGGSAWMCRCQIILFLFVFVDSCDQFIDAKWRCLQIYMVSMNSWTLFTACIVSLWMSRGSDVKCNHHILQDIWQRLNVWWSRGGHQTLQSWTTYDYQAIENICSKVFEGSGIYFGKCYIV